MGVPSAPDLWRRPMRGAVPNPQSAGGWPLIANGRHSAAAPCNTFWRERTGLCCCLFRADPSKSRVVSPGTRGPSKPPAGRPPGPVLRVVCPGPCHGPDARGHTLGQGALVADPPAGPAGRGGLPHCAATCVRPAAPPHDLWGPLPGAGGVGGHTHPGGLPLPVHRTSAGTAWASSYSRRPPPPFARSPSPFPPSGAPVGVRPQRGGLVLHQIDTRERRQMQRVAVLMVQVVVVHDDHEVAVHGGVVLPPRGPAPHQRAPLLHGLLLKNAELVGACAHFRRRPVTKRNERRCDACRRSVLGRWQCRPPARATGSIPPTASVRHRRLSDGFVNPGRFVPNRFPIASHRFWAPA